MISLKSVQLRATHILQLSQRNRQAAIEMISLQPDFPEALKKSLKEKVIKQNIKVIEKKENSGFGRRRVDLFIKSE